MDGLLLAEISRTQRKIVETRGRLDEIVAVARAAGHTWEEIGSAAGITRQSAQARWATRIAPGEQPRHDRLGVTTDDIARLTDIQIGAGARTWAEWMNTEPYLTGREALASSAGPVDPESPLSRLLSDSTLKALEHAVLDRLGGVPGPLARGLTSSARWAYLATADPEALSIAQFEALTAGWRAVQAAAGFRGECVTAAD